MMIQWRCESPAGKRRERSRAGQRTARIIPRDRHGEVDANNVFLLLHRISLERLMPRGKDETARVSDGVPSFCVCVRLAVVAQS